MTIVLYALGSVILSGIGQVLLRWGAMTAPSMTLGTMGELRTWTALLVNAPVVGGLMAWALATVLWIVVLNRAPLTQVYMLGSLNYLVVPLLGRWLFAEPLSRVQLLGMAMICAGVLLALLGRDRV